MAKSYEMTFDINGNIGSSFTGAFKKATGSLGDLKTQARATQQELDRLGKDFRQGKIHQSQYADETQKLSRELKALENQQQRVNSLKSFGSNTINTTKTVASVAAVGAAAIATSTAISSINTAADFESKMSAVAAKTEAANSEMKALTQTAITLGAQSSLSASETAIAMDELAAKGLNAEQIISAMPGIIASAEASGEDLALVSDVVTSAINAYGMSAKEASRVADIMSMSANKTAAGVADLGYAFKYAAPVGKTLKIEIEELAAATGILVDKGLAGEQAGTALRMALVRLSSPPKAAQKALNALNISATDSKGNFKSLSALTADWTKSTAKLSDTQKVQYASTIFGTEAATAMLSLFEGGPAKIDEMTESLKNSGGAAAEAAAIMKDNFAGAKEQMSGAFESAQIAFATPILPVLQDIFNAAGTLIEDNMVIFENAGQTVANTLENIAMPFLMTSEPVKPVIEPHFDPDYAAQAMANYQKELEQYEMFGDMSMTEKVEYMLDETVATIEAWVSGPGGEIMGKIFTELGALAGKAWWASFKGATLGSVESLFDGNFAGALGLGTAAYMMGGGALLKGGFGAGKWAVDTFKGRKGGKVGKGTGSSTTKKNATAINPNDPKKMRDQEPTKTPATTAKVSPKGKKTETKSKKTTATTITTDVGKGKSIGSNILSYGGKVFKGAEKILGKALAPIGVLTSVGNIFKSDNKVKAAGEAAGGAAGGWAGAKLGAAGGTAILPGIGTAIGGLLGGAAGYIGGSWLGGWLGGGSNEAQASTKATANAIPMSDSYPVTNTSTAVGQASTNYTTSVNNTSSAFSQLATDTAQASSIMVGSMTALETETNLVTLNMGNLAMYVGQASGWLATLQGVQPAGQEVIDALNNLRDRINAMELPGSSGRLQYE